MFQVGDKVTDALGRNQYRGWIGTIIEIKENLVKVNFDPVYSLPDGIWEFDTSLRKFNEKF